MGDREGLPRDGWGARAAAGKDEGRKVDAHAGGSIVRGERLSDGEIGETEPELAEDGRRRGAGRQERANDAGSGLPAVNRC